MRSRDLSVSLIAHAELRLDESSAIGVILVAGQSSVEELERTCPVFKGTTRQEFALSLKEQPGRNLPCL
jgi:hypothetical protein